MSDKMFSVAGIVTDGKGRTKVRYCNDLVGRVKLFTKNSENKRVEFVELPSSMSKPDVIKFLMTSDKFASAEDQMVLSDALSSIEPKSSKTTRSTGTKTVKVTSSKKTKPSLDAIRARKVTTEQVLAAIATTEEATF